MPAALMVSFVTRMPAAHLNVELGCAALILFVIRVAEIAGQMKTAH